MQNQLTNSNQIISSSRRAPLRFLTIFAGIVTVYYILTAIPWIDRCVVYPILVNSAGGASTILNLFGSHTILHGVVIQGPDFAVAVRRGCDPLEPIVLFSAAIVAFPGPWRPKLWGMSMGVVFFYSLNVMRILSLYLTGQYKSAWFDSVHQEWWPALFILSAVLLWFVWLWRLQKDKQQHHA